MKFSVLFTAFFFSLCFNPVFAQLDNLESIRDFKQSFLQQKNNQLDNPWKPATNATLNTAGHDEFGTPPDWELLRKFGGDGLDRINDLVEDENGDFIIVGSFNGSLTLGDQQLESKGIYDTFLAKISPAGQILWLRHFEAEEGEYLVSNALCLDSGGRVYITGYFTGTVSSLETVITTTSRATFVCKLVGEGDPVFTFRAFSNSDFEGTKIRVDADRHVYLLVRDPKIRARGRILKFFSGSSAVSSFGNDNFPITDFDLTDEHLFLTGLVTFEVQLGPSTLIPTSPYGNAVIGKSSLDFEFEWAKMASTEADGDNVGLYVKATGDGGCYASGSFRRSTTLWPHDAPAYASGTYLTRLESNGDFAWARFIESNGNDFQHLETDSDGEVYITGSFKGSLSLASSGTEVSNGENQTHLFQVKSDTGEFLNIKPLQNLTNSILGSNAKQMFTAGGIDGDLFIQPLETTNLNPEWSLQSKGASGSASAFIGGRIDLDKMGNAFWSGNYRYHLKLDQFDFYSSNPGVALAKMGEDMYFSWAQNLQSDGGRVSLSSQSYNGKGRIAIAGNYSGTVSTPLGDFDSEGESYIAQYNAYNGNMFQFITFGEAVISSLAHDAAGNIFVSGTFPDELKIGSETLVSTGLWDAFVAKFSDTGTLLWVQQGQGDDIEYSCYLDTDANNNLYLAMEVYSNEFTFGGMTINTEEGDGNIFIAQLNTDGETQWIKPYGGSADLGSNALGDYFSWPQAIKTDSDGNTYMIGWFGPDNYLGDQRFTNPDWAINGSGSLHRFNWFVMKVDAQGEVLWANTIHKRLTNWPSFQIDYDSEGNLYIGGSLRDSIIFEDEALRIHPELGYQRKSIVAKYNPEGNLEWLKSSNGDFLRFNALAVGLEDKLTLLGEVSIQAQLDEQRSLTATNTNLFLLSTGDLSTATNSIAPEAFHYTNSPNPFTEIMTVSFTLEESEVVELSIFDVQGHLLQLKSLGILTSGLQAIPLNLGDLPAGMYLVQLKIGEELRTKKVEKL